MVRIRMFANGRLNRFGYRSQTVNLVPRGEWFESTASHQQTNIIVDGSVAERRLRRIVAPV